MYGFLYGWVQKSFGHPGVQAGSLFYLKINNISVLGTYLLNFEKILFTSFTLHSVLYTKQLTVNSYGIYHRIIVPRNIAAKRRLEDRF